MDTPSQPRDGQPPRAAATANRQASPRRKAVPKSQTNQYSTASPRPRNTRLSAYGTSSREPNSNANLTAQSVADATQTARKQVTIDCQTSEGVASDSSPSSDAQRLANKASSEKRATSQQPAQSGRKNISIQDPKTLEDGPAGARGDHSRSGDSLGSELSPPAKIISPASNGFSLQSLVKVEHKDCEPEDNSSSASETLQHDQQGPDQTKDRIAAIQSKVFQNNQIGKLIMNNQFENSIHTRIPETLAEDSLDSKVDRGSLKFEQIKKFQTKFQNRCYCETRAHRCKRCSAQGQQVYIIDMKTAIDAAEKLHSPKSSESVEKRTFPARDGHANRSYSLKRRSRGVNHTQQDDYEAHRPVEDGSIQLAIDGRLSNQYTFNRNGCQNVFPARKGEQPPKSGFITLTHGVGVNKSWTAPPQVDREDQCHTGISTQRAANNFVESALIPILQTKQDRGSPKKAKEEPGGIPNLLFQTRITEKSQMQEDSIPAVTQGSYTSTTQNTTVHKHRQLYMSKEQQQFKISDISARRKDESRRRAEVQKQPSSKPKSKSKMPFNHFQHPTHHQYPVGADGNVRKHIRKSRQQSKKEPHDAKDGSESAHLQIEKQSHTRFQNLGIQQKIQSSVQNIYVLVNSQEQTYFLDKKKSPRSDGSKESNQDMKRVSFQMNEKLTKESIDQEHYTTSLQTGQNTSRSRNEKVDFIANQTTMRSSFLKRQSNGPKKPGPTLHENNRYRSVEETPEVPTPISPILHSTLKKNFDNRDLTAVVGSSKLSAYSNKEDKNNTTTVKNSPRRPDASSKVKIDSASYSAKQHQMQGDLRLNFETLTKRSTQNKVTVGSIDKSVDTQNKDLVDIQEAPTAHAVPPQDHIVHSLLQQPQFPQQIYDGDVTSETEQGNSRKQSRHVVQRPVQMNSTQPLRLNIAETLTKREVPTGSLGKNRSSENLIELKTQKDVTEETPNPTPGQSPIKTERQMDKASSKYEKTKSSQRTEQDITQAVEEKNYQVMVNIKSKRQVLETPVEVRAPSEERRMNLKEYNMALAKHKAAQQHRSPNDQLEIQGSEMFIFIPPSQKGKLRQSANHAAFIASSGKERVVAPHNLITNSHQYQPSSAAALNTNVLVSRDVTKDSAPYAPSLAQQPQFSSSQEGGSQALSNSSFREPHVEQVQLINRPTMQLCKPTRPVPGQESFLHSSLSILDLRTGNELKKFNNKHASLSDELFINDQDHVDKKLSVDMYYKQRQQVNEGKYINQVSNKIQAQIQSIQDNNSKRRQLLIDKGELLESLSRKRIETYQLNGAAAAAEVGRRSITCKAQDGPTLLETRVGTTDQSVMEKTSSSFHSFVTPGLINRDRICFEDMLKFAKKKVTKQDIRKSIEKNQYMMQIRTNFQQKAEEPATIMSPGDSQARSRMDGAELSKSLGGDIWKANKGGIRGSVDLKHMNPLMTPTLAEELPPRSSQVLKRSQLASANYQFQKQGNITDGFRTIASPVATQYLDYDSYTNQTNVRSGAGIRTRTQFSSPTGHTGKPKRKLPASVASSIEVASKGLGNKDYLDFLANKTPILPLLALKHKLDQRADKLQPVDSKMEIQTSDFQIQLYHERANRKFKDNHPLLANVSNDAERTIQERRRLNQAEEYQDISHIINDRYPMPKRMAQTSKEMTRMDILFQMSNFELDLLGYSNMEDVVPSSYRSFENQLMYKHKNTGDTEKAPEVTETAAAKQQPAPDSVGAASPATATPFNHSLLDARKQLYTQDEPIEHSMINKFPALMVSQQPRGSPRLRMKDHMLSFKTIEQGEMIKCGLVSRKAADETVRKQKDKLKRVPKTEDFQLSFFEEQLDKYGDVKQR